MKNLLGAAVAWAILLSPLAAGAIVVRSYLSGRRGKSELVLAVFAALFGGLFWMFAATGHALQSGRGWVVWLAWGVIAAIVFGAAARARLSITEWVIVVAVVYMFGVLPYESKVKVEPGARHARRMAIIQ